MGLRADRAAAVYVDSRTNDTWLGGPVSMYHLNERFRFSYIPCDTSLLPAGFPKQSLQYHTIYKDKHGMLWSFSHSWLFKLDPGTKQIIGSFDTGNAFVKAFYQDSAGNYWIGTFGNGLLLFDTVTGNSKKVTLPTDAEHVYAINEWKDKNSHRWLTVGTSIGLLLVDPVTLSSRLYTFEPADDAAVSNGDIVDVFVDRENILWLATENGVSYVEPARQAIDAWSIVPDSSRLKDPKPGFAYCFYEEDDGYWAGNWIKAGLCRFDKYGRKKNGVHVLFPSPDKALLAATSQPFDIVRDTDGSFWFTTDAGIVHRNASNKNATLYKPAGNNLNVGFRNIIEYNAHTWWIRTRNNDANGIYAYDHVKKTFTGHYTAKPYLHDLVATRSHHIYTAPSDNYLYVFDENKNHFVPLITDESVSTIFPSKSFECMAEDGIGHLWIGTSNGLFEFDPEKKKLVRDYSKDKRSGASLFRNCVLMKPVISG